MTIHVITQERVYLLNQPAFRISCRCGMRPRFEFTDEEAGHAIWYHRVAERLLYFPGRK